MAPGTYLENIDFIGKAVTLQSIGGSSVTAIDGNQAGSVVVFGNGEGPDSVLDGFTLMNGTGTGQFGGGIFCYGASPTIRNNRFTGNTAIYGGGIYCLSLSAPMITNNLFTGNTAMSGGGIYCSWSSPGIMNNTLTGNHADNGGGVYCSWSSL